MNLTMKRAVNCAMKVLRACVVVPLLWLLAGTCCVNAEVNPLATSLPLQDWMVRVYVQAPDGSRYLLCKGALISSQLVLTTGNCYADPFHALDAAGKNTPVLVVKIGSTAELITVADFRRSPDFMIGLIRLDRPAKSQPIAVGKSTAAQLLNKDVYILSDQKSLGISHDYFNPGSNPHADCMVNDSVFFTDKSNAARIMCYLLGKTETSATVYQTSAKVIDPESAEAPNSTLDRYDTFDTSGARLYLDFRAGNSYPCNEDLGAPVVANNSDGIPELVGVVAAVGMANSLPVCNQALINRFSAVAYYKDYLDQATAQSAFASLCPQAPTLYFQNEGKTTFFYWNDVGATTGYKFHVTTELVYRQIQTSDLGNKTYNRMTLEPNIDYTVAISAYNANCTSGISKQYTVWQ